MRWGDIWRDDMKQHLLDQLVNEAGARTSLVSWSAPLGARKDARERVQ